MPVLQSVTSLQVQQQMASDVNDLEKGVDKLAEMLTSVEQQKEDFIKRVAEAEEAIFKKTEEMKQLIERNKETLINELAIKKAEVLKQVTNVSEMIALRISLMESIKQYTQELSSKGAADYVAREISTVHSRVEELLKCQQIERSRNDMDSINVQFTETVTPTSEDYNLIGKIAVKVVPAGGAKGAGGRAEGGSGRG
jgi:DNA repair exonuclease SbcCD ATPase subunit